MPQDKERSSAASGPTAVSNTRSACTGDGCLEPCLPNTIHASLRATGWHGGGVTLRPASTGSARCHCTSNEWMPLVSACHHGFDVPYYLTIVSGPLSSVCPLRQCGAVTPHWRRDFMKLRQVNSVFSQTVLTVLTNAGATLVTTRQIQTAQ